MYHPFLSRRGIKAKGQAAFARITLNRFTTFFFVFSFIYCFAQGIVQSLLFSLDFEYSTLVSGIIEGGHIPPANTSYRTGTTGNMLLRICDDIPHGQTPYPCTTVFNSTVNSPRANGSAVTTLQTRWLTGWENGLSITPQFDPLNSTVVTAVEVGMSDGSSVVLSEQCIQILVYPSQLLNNLRREDITWIVLQFWLLAISFIAILNDSVPHVLAVLMTRTISSGWATYAIWRGPMARNNFQELIADAGTPCALDLFGAFFDRRQGFEIADLVLSTTGLVFFSYLSWTLLKIYNAQCFKCVGAPEHVMRIHKFFMALLACLQMEVFVLAAGMGLWINVLLSTSMLHISAHTQLYEVLYISTIILLLPWISMGWYSIRREMKTMMIGFLAIGFIIFAGWAILFYSIVFRWVFVQWPYLGCWTVASFILLFATMTLGVICRINFGKGLAEYLHAESALASLNFAPDAFDVKASSPTRFSRSSMRKGTLDFKDIADADFDDLDLNGPPMYFISTSAAMALGSEQEYERGEQSRGDRSPASSIYSQRPSSVKRVPVPSIVITTPYASDHSPSSLNLHPYLASNFSSGSSSTSSSNSDVELGMARPKRPSEKVQDFGGLDGGHRPRPF